MRRVWQVVAGCALVAACVVTTRADETSNQIARTAPPGLGAGAAVEDQGDPPCCFADGLCAELTTDDCYMFGGESQQGGTTCAAVACPADPGPTVACCFPAGTCTDLPDADCRMLGGQPQGAGTDCGTVVCEPFGACCLTSGMCIDDAENACAAAGGTFQGIASDCATIACPQPVACCLPSGSCAMILTGACAAAGGAEQGASCAGVVCAPPVYRGGCSEKGSLLVFSKIEIRWELFEEQFYRVTQDTLLSLTNDSQNSVRVQAYFINGDPPAEEDELGDGERAHPGWNWIDNSFVLTGNEPCYWSTVTGQPKGVVPFWALDPGDPPGRPAMDGTNDRVMRGYALVWAINNSGDEIRHNHLSGTGTLLNYAEQYAWEYNACAFRVLTSFTDGGPTGTPGILHVDGSEYAALYDELLLNFYASAEGADTDLTLHPLGADLQQNNAGPITTKASFTIWNENEIKFSNTHRCITCWDQTLLSRYDNPNSFLASFLGTTVGKARIDGHAATVCNELDDPDTPEDESVTSVAAPLLGVYARHLAIGLGFTGGPSAAAGGNLVGLGEEGATIEYDPFSLPGESEYLPDDTSPAGIDAFLERMIERLETTPPRR